MDRTELIQLANDRMSILDAFHAMGADVWYGTSGKTYCPFGSVYHIDGGMERAMRVYPETNSAYCFASCGYFNPTKVVAMFRDISEVQAAEVILDLTGYTPPTFESRLESLLDESVDVDTDALAEALKVACRRMTPDWDTVQLNREVSETLNKCFALLDSVRDEQDAARWMDACTDVMRFTLRGA